MRRIVLHVGLPKAASTNMQFWLDKHRRPLLNKGVNYPLSNAGTYAPKHQELVVDLMQGHARGAHRLIAENQADTLLLSTEGISNHLWDFPQNGLDALRQAFSDFDLTVLVTHRPFESWSRSYWVQNAINGYIPKYLYGTGLTLDEFRQEERVRRLGNRLSLETGCREKLGAKEVIFADTPARWYETLADVLGHSDLPAPPANAEHISPPQAAVELIRQINIIRPDEGIRNAAIGAIQRVVKSGHNQMKQAALAQLPQTVQAPLILLFRQLVIDTEDGAELREKIVSALTRDFQSFCQGSL